MSGGSGSGSRSFSGVLARYGGGACGGGGVAVIWNVTSVNYCNQFIDKEHYQNMVFLDGTLHCQLHAGYESSYKAYTS